VRKARDALFDRQGFRGHVASALKAFYPSRPPFPLLHVDTGWKFREMIAFRDRKAKKLGLELLVHMNEDGVREGVGPFTHGSAYHTDVMKTVALKQALDKYGFDAAFGGARRDEEKSRAKERISRFRTARHRWDPKNQRPELWNLYNARMHKGESRCAPSRCPTGPSSTSGNTSAARTSSSCRSTSPRPAPSSTRWHDDHGR
jgi:sulfate adenylyltransferase small subunit